jgi:type VI secretion system protein ImpM
MNDAPNASPGYHGKLVAKGDFVTRRLPRSFVDPWDSWLQEVISGSRARMGEAWLDAYLTSPIWRFVLSAGLCGEQAAAGVLMPSVDRVGRYFPLSIVALVPDGCAPIALPATCAAWFQAAEELIRSALEDAVDFDRFDADVAALRLAADSNGPEQAAGSERALRLSIASADAVDQAYRSLLSRVLPVVHPRYSLWWTAGSADMGATFLLCPGLPEVDSFGAFLDGRWEHWGWDGPSPSPAALAAPA